MANSFSKEEKILFAEVVEGFQNQNLTAKMMDKFSPGTQAVGRSGGSFRFTKEDQAEITTGINVDGEYKDKVESTVSVTIGESDVYNAPFQFTAFDASDPTRKQRAIKGGIKKLSSYLDTLMQETIVKQGALINTLTTDISKYEHLALADQSYCEIESFGYDAHMLVPPKIATKVVGDIANRSTMNDNALSAYEKGVILDVNGIPTYKSNVTNRLAAAASGAVTVNGANQDKQLVSWRSDKDIVPLAANQIDDERYQTLTVTGATLTNGDIFTIDNVNRVGMDTKKDTDTPMTFRVISGGGTTTPVISPAIIATGPYQNVSAAPANSAVITKINTTATNPVVHADKSSCIWVGSEFNVDDLQGSMAIDTYTTDSGITILFARQGEIGQLGTKYRCTIWGRPNLVDPMRAGLILPNQAVAIGYN